MDFISKANLIKVNEFYYKVSINPPIISISCITVIIGLVAAESAGPVPSPLLLPLITH